MKRSDFFKSLLGLAIAPVVAKEVWQGRDQFEHEYGNPRKKDLPTYSSKHRLGSVATAVCSVSTAWMVSDCCFPGLDSDR